MWIIIGVVLIFVVIALACLGFWGCRYWKQRKTAAKSDGKTKQTLRDKKIIEIPVKQEKAVEEKVKTTKEETEEKKEVIQAKPKMAKHEIKEGCHPILAKTPQKKTVEPTQEETPSGKTVEPTVEDTNTNPSIAPNYAPTVTVLKEPIHPPRPYGLAPRSKSYSKSRKTDSLSGRHDLNMNCMVETPLQTLERCKSSVVNDDMKKFYPPEDKPRRRDLREIVILYCSISAMFRMIQELM
uniref:Uncharacterized protein n=1 Tax=Panagrolaimus superbus TaxID=310955 RepID=A0A914Z8W2_9BILA